jgi:hypothetical protein
MGNATTATNATDLGPGILKRAAAARDRLWLVSPYVTSGALVAAVRACGAPSKRLLTRYNASDILTGATDLRVVGELAAAGVEVRVLSDVHAKVYVFDDWAYVGSANLTNHGLAASLREFGSASAGGSHVVEALEYFETLWKAAPKLRPGVLASTLEKLETMRSDLDAAQARQRKAEKDLVPEGLAPPAYADSTQRPQGSRAGTSGGPQASSAMTGLGGLAILPFHDVEPGSDHDRFMNWRRENEGGFYLTLKSKTKANLHKADCKHQGNYDWADHEYGGGSATKDRKLCAQTPPPLYDWAREVAPGSRTAV